MCIDTTLCASAPVEPPSASGTAPHSSDDESEPDWGEHDGPNVDDLESDHSEVEEDPSAYFERLDLALAEVKIVEAEGKNRIVSGSIEGLFAALISPTAGKLDRYVARTAVISTQYRPSHVLLTPLAADAVFIESFLATHRYFIESLPLMRKLQQQYDTFLTIIIIKPHSFRLSYIGVKLDSKMLPTDQFRTFRSRQAAIRQR